MVFQKMDDCNNCGGKIMRTWDIYGEFVRCIECSTEVSPPIEIDILKSTSKGGNTPTHGQDTFSWKEKNPWTKQEAVRRRNAGK